MYRVHFTYTEDEGRQYDDCLAYDDLEFSESVVDKFKKNPKVSNLRIAHHAISNWCEAGAEIDRLRKLLAQAYGELQQLKEGYNSYIKKIHDPKLLLVVNVSEEEVVFYVKDGNNSIVEVKIPKEDFHSPACVLDFNDAEITNDWRTVRFGQYECSVESVLEYKYNPYKYAEEEKVFD